MKKNLLITFFPSILLRNVEVRERRTRILLVGLTRVDVVAGASMN